MTNDVRVLLALGIAILIFIFLLVAIVFSAFNATLYGLSYDIMSSGDLYTEFRKAFSHFKNHWFPYMILSFVLLLTSFIYQYFTKDMLIGYLVFVIIDYFTIMVLSGTFASVTAQGNLITAVKESFSLIRKDFFRIAVSIGLYFIIFRIPYIIGVWITKLGLTINFVILFLLLAILGIMIFSSLIGNPILSIIATRIYNTNNQN